MLKYICTVTESQFPIDVSAPILLVVITSVVVLETMVLVSSGLEAKSAGLGLGLAFKQDQDLITCNFYCAISATKL